MALKNQIGVIIMESLIAKKSWVGMEGSIKRGDEFTPVNKDREKELIDSGRAVYASENKSVEVKEVKGGSAPDKEENKDVEVKKVEVTETKEKPKRKRRTKAEIEADKEAKEMETK